MELFGISSTVVRLCLLDLLLGLMHFSFAGTFTTISIMINFRDRQNCNIVYITTELAAFIKHTGLLGYFNHDSILILGGGS